MTTYLLVFMIAWGLAYSITPLSIRLGQRLDLADQPGGRRQHAGAISRLGGLALFGGFVGTGSLLFIASGLGLGGEALRIQGEDYKLLSGILVGSTIIFGLSLADDWYELSARLQFLIHLLAAGIAIYFDIIFQVVTLPIVGETQFEWWLYYPLTIFWIVGMINTVNWLDGLDGLAAGVTAIASLIFAIHAYRLGQSVVAFFPLALAGACLGFLPANFYPARVFMGGGSMLLGYALATMSILAPAKIATALLVLGIPILDVAWLIIYRWRQRGNPMQSGRDHLHYRLFDLGFSQRQIVLLYYSFCGLFGLQALLITDRLYKLLALIIMSGLTLALLWWLAQRGDGAK
ncbi:MraY family glycosyltransferase [Anaerolineales bacterium HSG25]|nr:MraY family glycosyltransferase [Anaerolineales bacterium HSG25]